MLSDVKARNFIKNYDTRNCPCKYLELPWIIYWVMLSVVICQCIADTVVAYTDASTYKQEREWLSLQELFSELHKMKTGVQQQP